MDEHIRRAVERLEGEPSQVARTSAGASWALALSGSRDEAVAQVASAVDVDVAIFLRNFVKNAIEEGKRIPKRMEMGSDLGTCVKWIEDIGVPVIYAYSAYYSAKCRGMMKGEGQSMRVAFGVYQYDFRTTFC